MSTRRSARIHNQGVQQAQPPAESLQTTTIEKRKAPAEPANKKKRAKSVTAKVKSLKVASRSRGSRHCPLLSLPPEILNQVLDHVKDSRAMSRLGRTCRKLNAITTPMLYRRLAVRAPCYTYFHRFMRAIYPCLSIAQKQRLKDECNWRGQQKMFPSVADPLAKPALAECVRQVIVGWADPGPKHKRIAHRYLEEAFRNMKSLEVVAAALLKGTMVKRVASLEHLKALRLFLRHDATEPYLRPLTRIRNLRHLHVDATCWGWALLGAEKIFQSMVLNSRATLRSLGVKASSRAPQFLPLRDELDSLHDVGHTLTALTSLELSGVFVDKDFIEALDKAIDFLGLHRLVLGFLLERNPRLYEYLAHKATSTRSEEIKLRRLRVESMYDGPSSIEEYESICRFFASFDTLTELEIESYYHCRDTTLVCNGLPDSVLLSISNHKNLTRLAVSYNERYNIPYISPPRVATILENFPLLDEFQFTPEAGKGEETGAVLARGPNLRTVTCFSHMNWSDCHDAQDQFINPMHSILDGFLNEGSSSKDGKAKFVWEDHFKLRRLGVLGRAWDVASWVWEPEENMMKAEQRFSRDGKREVWCKDISTSLQPRGVELYQASCEWVDWVSEFDSHTATH